ncbi:hypothetical protein EDB80DRAFT_598857 [Ilyonectria destructans]|nr:hypothetical protein EDB80DRAFT_598857 [Ilyonectria destructans]
MDSQSLPDIPSGGGSTSNASLQEKVARTIREAHQDEPPKDVFVKDVWPILEADYETMVQELVEFCKNKLHKKPISCNVTGRVKCSDSISRSLHRREKNLTEKENKQYKSLADVIDDIHDLAGIRIVVDFQSDIENVSSFIQTTFQQLKSPNDFSPDRKVSEIWQPLFGAYRTCNYRVGVEPGTSGRLSQYCGVMFEIQLTDIAESLYNRFAHSLLYKKSSGRLRRQDEIVIDMTHGISLLYSLCLVYMQDRLEGSARDSDVNNKLRGALRRAEGEGNLDALMETIPKMPGSDVQNRTISSAGGSSLKRRASFRETIPIATLKKALEPSEGHTSADDLWALLINMSSDTERENQRDVADADAWIRDKHYNADRLKIERLSGDLLSMDQCYINLAVVEKPGQGAGHTRGGSGMPSPFSLFARQKVETPNKTIQVELPTLFSQRIAHNNRTVPPRRILIRGRAGVGKTTLCKKMVYDFTHGTQTELHRTWAKLFDRLLWVPLRNLKRRSAPGYNHEELFYHEYFSGQGRDRGRHSAGRLWQTLNDTNSSRTLFVLDGLDEVSELLDPDSEMFEFLQDLLHQPNVIITSRPHTSLPPSVRNPDLDLETIGFYPEQVKAYLEADPNINPRANEVLSFLQDHWLIQGLVRIPIQLDALCFTWEDFDSGIQPDTMTSIYKAIVEKLWKKDVLRLEKKHDGERVTRSQIQMAEVEDFVKHEVCFLECLGFTGLHNDVLEFKPEHLRTISKYFKDTKLVLDKTLPRLSFLRNSDASPKDRHLNYHFLHLTFQEYFAARYFVRKWTSGEKLSTLKFDSRRERFSATKINPEKFLQKEKYNIRYNILWRFVAGLLHSNHDEEQLCRFFYTIEGQPRDLLGPVHQRLVMHCLSEVGPLQETLEFNRLRRNLEAQLKQWLLFECNFTFNKPRQPHLSTEMEFPDSILQAVLQEECESVKLQVLASLRARPSISQPMIECVVPWLRGNAPIQLKTATMLVFRRPLSLSEETLQTLVALLKDPDSGIRSSAVVALGWQSALSEETLVALLKDPDVRSAAAEALRRQPALSEETLQALLALLENPDGDAQSYAAEALGSQSTLSDGTLKALVALLEDLDSDIRSHAADALGRQPTLSEETLQALVALLEDPESNVRSSAAKSLGSRSTLSGGTVQALMTVLKDPDGYVRSSAADALGSQSALPEGAIQALMTVLKDPDSCVRSSAAAALGSQSALPEGAIQALMTILKDPNSYVRSSAARAVGRQSALSDKIFTSFLRETDRRSFEALYSMGISESFSNHLICHATASNCKIIMPEAEWEIPFDRLKISVERAQMSLEVPVPLSISM